MGGDGVEKARKQRSMKACDRCRLKKVKCCGSVPCLRCRQDDAICEYGIRRDSEGKSVSAAHVNQLQMHNELLVKAIKKLWETYAKPALGEEGTETPSLHELIQKAGVLDEFSARQLQQTNPKPVFAPVLQDSPGSGGPRRPSKSSAQAYVHSHHNPQQQHQQEQVRDRTMSGGSNPDVTFDAFHFETALEEDYYYSDNNFNDNNASNGSTNHRSGSGDSSSSAYSSSATPVEAPNMTELSLTSTESGVSGIKRANKPRMKLAMPPLYMPPQVNSARHGQSYSEASYQSTTHGSYQAGSSGAMDDAMDSWAFN